jgi:hypothetical protein
MTKRIQRPSEWVVRVLTTGWGSPLPAGTLHTSGLPVKVQDEIAQLWRAGLPGLVEIWRLHECWLRHEAARLGIRPMFSYGDRKVYFAELITAAASAATLRGRRPAKGPTR